MTDPTDGTGRPSRTGLRRLRLRRSGRPSLLWRFRRPLFALGLVGVFTIGGAGYVFAQVPLPDRDPPQLQTTFVCASDVAVDCSAENSIAQLSGVVDRVLVSYEEIPTVLIDAVLAAEDRTFFDHGGVDPVGIVRALWANLRNQGVTQGGSTITQQYVKNVYLTQERTFERKLKEAALAVKVERELPKQEILTRYLNTIYLGRGAYGVDAASRAYFGKDLAEITLPEAAYLAGLIRAPETADANLPESNARASANRATAEQRRNSVLRAMLVTGSITRAEYDAAVQTGWESVVVRSDRNSFGRVANTEWGTEHVIEYVRSQLVKSGRFTDAEIYGGGLRIYTTIDMEKQGAAAQAISSTLDRPDDPSAALVSINGQGNVVAMVGGLDFGGDGPYSKLNLAVGVDGGGSGRQAGSAFKAFTLAEAMTQGISLSRVYDAPARLVIPRADAGRDWTVANYADAGFGQLDVTTATMRSSNTAYAQMMVDVGAQNVAALANKMGVRSELEPVLALTLGTSEVSVLDMAAGYSTLAQGGLRIDPAIIVKVTDARGNVLYEPDRTRERVLSPTVTQKVNWALHQTVVGGTATAAAIGKPSAGKTGTTENYRDAWFAGFTCDLTTAVWVGYPDGTFMKDVRGIDVTGGSFPSVIWNKYQSVATEGMRSCPFTIPPDEPDTGPDNTGSTVPETTSTTAAPRPTTTRPAPRPSTTSTTSTTVPRPSTTSTTTTTVPPAPD